MNNKGFTLIEMVVVIVLLGILAVTAAPRFLGISRDARIATLDAFAGAFWSANDVVMGKAKMHGLEHSMEIITIPGTDIDIRDGYVALYPDNIKRIMQTDGYGIFQFTSGKRFYSQVWVKLGEKYDDKAFDIDVKNCALLIERKRNFTDLNDGNLGELKVLKFYDGC
ncbi:hypothetical protein RJ45_06410 [Photobacterium gaetbulicola]|uniref:Prepilin-type N-terminal cleavage/methylation domain-containing protein n=1 Tax=Photobacterium gaetbulicola TaxID=1295392 RepID=A0A0B9G6V4_9GAMM|nr:type II secretion system protein [Photobacterium sp. DA100]KHT64448.1 hypothetical protein RJ45_06410 [Photobacterium gaetbulicola]WEM44499.1 type II secretion system protein [Photobacterium sp. DA100]